MLYIAYKAQTVDDTPPPAFRRTSRTEIREAVVPARKPCEFANAPEVEALPTVYAMRRPCLCAISASNSSDALLMSSHCSSPVTSCAPKGRAITLSSISSTAALFMLNPFASTKFHPSSPPPAFMPRVSKLDRSKEQE